MCFREFHRYRYRFTTKDLARRSRKQRGKAGFTAEARVSAVNRREYLPNLFYFDAVFIVAFASLRLDGFRFHVLGQ
jgi:hypothetical protein